MGIALTPRGAWGQAVAARGRAPQPRTGAQILRICFWRGGATAGGHRPRKRRNPRKARFFAKQKMRPNEVLKKSFISVNALQGETLYTENAQMARFTAAAQAPPR
jgi:hypothetical protein